MDEQAGPAVLFPGGGSVKPPLPGAGDAARALYSLPGALRFLQRQWASFERERHEWDAERSELQSQIALLQGERRGQENLRKDLLRRIKMLEYSLRQERGRFHRLKHGSDLIQDQLRPPDYDSDEEEESPASSHGPQSCAQGQQIISRFLEELGYNDVLEVKSNRVRVLLGLSPDQEPKTSQDSLDPLRCVESVMETFRIVERAAAQFNQDQDPILDRDADRDADRDVDRDLDQEEDPTTADLMVRRHSTVSASSSSSSSSLSEDADTEEALRGFDFLCGAEESAPCDLDLSLGRTWDQSVIEELKEQYKRERRGKKGVKRPNRSKLQDMLSNLREAEDLPSGAPPGPPRSGRFSEQETGRPDDESVFVASPGKSFLLGPVDEAVSLDLGLGELAGLTVANECEGPMYDVSVGSGDSVRRTWSQKFSLRSHLDSVRSVVFHPTEPLLLTASEDHTLKLWNLHKTNPNKKCAALDVEPIYTFRAHSAAVLGAVMSSSGEQFFSAGADGAIYSWNTPSAATDPYDPYEPGVLRGALSGHSDAVWGVAYSSAHQRLISCSADGTLRVWDATETQPALTVIRTDLGAPSSLDLVASDPVLVVCSFTSGPIALFNLETQQQVLSLETGPGTGPGTGPETGPETGVNQVLSHPSLPLTISAGEDRHIRFYDNNTGKLVHSMVAHLDSVTCLCVDPNGLYLLSGSHDCSVRLWSLDSRTCVQEFTAHRRKFHESIHAVSFHRTLGYMCSGGADALAKVYV